MKPYDLNLNLDNGTELSQLHRNINMMLSLRRNQN